MIMLKDALARLRRERGLTQEELARRLYITRQAVSRWEVGAAEPSIDSSSSSLASWSDRRR